MAVLTPLSREVLEYQDTGRGWKELFDKVLIFVYRYPTRQSYWTEEYCSDFLLSYQPRIPGMIHRYKPQSSFETYLNNGLCWFMRTYRERLMKQRYYESWTSSPVRIEYDECSHALFTEPACEAALVPKDNHSCKKGCGRTAFPVDGEGRFTSMALRKRLVYVALLNAAEIEEEQLEEVARLAGTALLKLQEQIEQIKLMVEDRMEKKYRLTERRNECWYKMEHARHRARKEEAGRGEGYREWQRKTATWEHRYQRACRELSKARTAPSHGEIGRVLNIPVGTVSSGLSLIRKACRQNRLENTPQTPSSVSE